MYLLQRNGGMAAASDVTITVCDPRKAGDGVGAFIAYTLKTETTRAKWNGKTFEVTRRFSDFLGLYEKLAGKYQHKGFFILPAPEKSITSFTKGTARVRNRNKDFRNRLVFETVSNTRKS